MSYIKKAIIFFCCVCFLNILFFQSSHSALAATNLSSCTTFNRSLAPDDKDSTTGGLVSKLQWFLVYNGYLLTTPTGHYGPATIAAVQKFQNKYGIVSDGILGAATEEKIQDLSCFSNAVLPLNLPTNTTDTSSNSNSKTCVVLSRSLGPNDKDSTTGGVLLGLVSKLQQFLIHQGYLKAASTGNFGPATVAAVQNFQKDNKIVSSGSPSTTGYGAVGKLTRTTIENISCNQSGGSSLLPTGISSLPLPCTPPALFNYQTGISCLLATSTATTATTTQIYIGGGYSGGGGGGGSSVQLPGIPSGPTNLGAVSNTIGQVTVSWTNTANNQSGFNVYRSTNEGATFSSIGTANANDTSYTDTTATPGVKYMYRVSATNIGGESTPMYYISANALANFQANTHPEPTRVGWTLGGPSFQSSAPTGVVTIDSTRPGSVFYPGEPLFFYLNSAQYAPGGYAKTYEVRNYDGAIVDSGPVVDGKDLTLNSEPLGWYKLYLFGSATTAQNGDQIGDTTFSIIRPNTNFPSTDDMYVTGGYNAGYKFIKDHIQVDQTINFPGWAGGPNPVDGSTPFISDPNTPDPATYKNTLFTV
ncbi:MAG TPA: peptidoglycan-binding protein, partial [Candidatus Babeliales bacterium]|nr:peptidoglycan-binding protein [Candidatus Babeliales bacterium]